MAHPENPERAQRGKLTVTASAAHLWLLAVSLALLLPMLGCSRFHPKPRPEYVYVLGKQTYLRDRVAAVSNRTATVTNGQRLQVLEHGRRFLRVQTAKGEIGWLEERTVAPQSVEAGFAWLQRDHASDPTVATAILRDELYMHVKPGRDTDKLYLLPENEKLQLLVRASVEKNASGAKPLVRSPAAATEPSTAANTAHPTSTTPAEAAPEPPPMEDWWLARDSQGHTGWLLGRRMDVDVPDDLTKYSEGQRIVGAYVLATVHDPDIDQTAAGGNIKEYVTVLSAPRDGLPYDFDQVRVYTWNLKKHRYETAYRERDIEGFLPVTLKDGSPYAAPNAATNANPQFTIRIAPADAGPILTDPVTGISRPAKLIEKSFQLEGNVVRRILPPGQTASQQPAEAHPEPLPGKKAKAAAAHRKHRK